MHCPRCGHQQNSDNIRFCTKCGLEISDVKELLTSEPGKTKEKQERIKARRQGMIIIFASFAFIIIFAGLREFYPLPKFIALLALLVMIGGAFRASMPALFGTNSLSKEFDDLPDEDLETGKLAGGNLSNKSLPEAEFRPSPDFETRTFDTNELKVPVSVTENTTRELKKEIRQK